MRGKPDRPRVAVVIPAGGRGTRVGGRLPKQFLKIQGEPILLATVRPSSATPRSTWWWSPPPPRI